MDIIQCRRWQTNWPNMDTIKHSWYLFLPHITIPKGSRACKGYRGTTVSLGTCPGPGATFLPYASSLVKELGSSFWSQGKVLLSHFSAKASDYGRQTANRLPPPPNIHAWHLTGVVLLTIFISPHCYRLPPKCQKCIFHSPMHSFAF